MGLLGRSSFIPGIFPKGLLSTAELIRCTFKFTGYDVKNTCEYPFFQLHSLLKSYGVLYFGLYVPFCRQYEMVFNHGFDYETILQGSSSSDFWHGTLEFEPENNTWYSKNRYELDSFLQLFSLNDRINISIIHIKFLTFSSSKKCILIAAQKNISSVAITDEILDIIDDNFSDLFPFMDYIVTHYIQTKTVLQTMQTIDSVDVISENCITNDLSGYMFSADASSIINSLMMKHMQSDAFILFLFFVQFFIQSIPENSVFFQKNFNIKIIIFTENCINISAYTTLLRQHLSSFFYTNCIQKLRLTLTGISQDTEELMQFITK